MGMIRIIRCFIEDLRYYWKHERKILRIVHTKEQATPELCDPFLYGPYDLCDDYCICSMCGQGWERDNSKESWGPFTIKVETKPADFGR